MAAGDTGFFLLWGFVLVLMVVGFGFEGVRKLRLVFNQKNDFSRDLIRKPKKTTPNCREDRLEK